MRGAEMRVVDHDGVRELRLDHPPANALRAELLAALGAAVDAAPRDGVRALVLSGAPGFFSAGLDVPYLLEAGREEVHRTFEALFACLRSLCGSTLPSVAALTGHATAGGAVLALCCDYRVMADGDYKVGLNEVQVGLPIPPVILGALERIVGPHAAERLCVEARLVGPREAERIALVDEVVALEEVLTAALAWCRRLLSLPPGAMRTTRNHARRRLLERFEQSDSLVPPEFSEAWSSEETQAALRALVERLKKR